ncbi:MULTISPECIES: hypothetical protein [unclassified Clostridium]|uniref:hypothetical protein n=1 Tax=unclassified Clostridium TaxID=2614128 RepID=UPI0025B85957|nr:MULTISPECIES: hypothetical protein [unclassified Clostridium]
MKNALELNIGGIKCDNPNCDYNSMDVKVAEYDKWLNKPCPKCGESLLTEEDYKNVQFLMKFVDMTNKIFPEIEDDSETVAANIKMNGTGEVNFNIKK